MNLLSRDMTLNYQSYEDMRETRTKNYKICNKNVNKSKKYSKKAKKIIKIKKKLQYQSFFDKEKSKFNILCPKMTEYENQKSNFDRKRENFVSKNQISNISSLYQKVSEQFFADLKVVTQKTMNHSKTVKKTNQKFRKPRQSGSVYNLLQKLKDQPLIKVLDLLKVNQRIFFKNNQLKQIEKYQVEAEQFLSLDNFFKHSQNHKCKQQKLQQQITVILSSHYNLKSTIAQIKNNPLECRTQLKGNLQTISFCQYQCLKELQNFQPLWQNEISNQINQTQDLKEISKILIVLLKCYKANNSKLTKILGQVLKKDEISSTRNDVSQKNKNSITNDQFYTKCLIKKCLIKTFSQEQTLIKNQRQLWNFFKKNSYFQQSIINEGFFNNDSYIPIETQEQYEDYIKRITNRKIFIKPILHTSCKACFSSHFEKYNPIIKCSQCKYRIHKSCGKVQDRCDRCNYKKLGTSLKQSMKKCIICKNETNSLMLHKIKGNKFVHNFCLMVHNLWTVENNRIAFDFEKQSFLTSKNNSSLETLKHLYSSIMIDETDQKTLQHKDNHKKSNQNEKTCNFCGQGSQGQKQFFKNCVNCNKHCHILCAYLNGCNIQIAEWKNNFDIDLKISCCPSQTMDLLQFEQKRKRLEMSRKYKINYENFATNYVKQTKFFTFNTSQNIQTPDRKLTKTNIQLEINNNLLQGPFKQQKYQQSFEMNV